MKCVDGRERKYGTVEKRRKEKPARGERAGRIAIHAKRYWGTESFLRAAAGADADCAPPSVAVDEEDDEASSDA